MAVDLAIPGYTDAEEIGRGSYATVYRARRAHFGDAVAVKLLDVAVDERSARRFEAELLALGRVSGHPNVTAVHDAGVRADRRPFIVMEYVPGGSLAEALARGGAWPWAEVVEIGVVLAEVLHWGHERGVIHQDVKPENVLL